MKRYQWYLSILALTPGCDSLLSTHKAVNLDRCEFVGQVFGSSQTSSQTELAEDVADAACQSWCEGELKKICQGKTDKETNWRCRFRGEILTETKGQCPQ